MTTFKSFESQIYDQNADTFDDIALSLFRFQAQNNPIYKSYVANLNINLDRVKSINQIPFMPIAFFKSQMIKTGEWNSQTSFTSSGTTNSTTSTHWVKDLNFYLAHAERCFSYFFDDLTDYHFLAFLPSYLERKGSSLIAMMDHFIKESHSSHSGFYLNNVEKLVTDLKELRGSSKKTILWGVSFALLELVETHNLDLSQCLIFETGGMKGRRKEITRQELHHQLKEGFNVKSIFSEYGMTELFSQAYSKGDTFQCPPWMKILARDISDPFSVGFSNETGAINVIDLANFHSVAFIETEDLGKVYEDGSFEILGRLDNSDVRGCNLLIS